MSTKKKATPVSPAPTAKRSLADFLLEKSTWAGLLTIGATLATGGVAEWLNSTTLPVLIAGAGLVLTKEGK